MADMYRKSALEKLSSPEQLDRMIVITSPSFWLAMLGAGLVILLALIWAIVGRLPVTVNSNGIYISDDGVRTVYADTAGVVASVDVSVGDTVTEGQTVATVADPQSKAQADQLQERIDQVEAVTLSSVDDVVTSDTKDLVEIKRSLNSAGYSVDQAASSLSVWQKQYETEKAALDSLAVKLEAAKSAYYAALESKSSGSSEQMAYQDAQEKYNAAATTVRQAQSALSTLVQEYQNYQQQLEALQAAVDSATDETALAQAQAQLEAYQNENASLESSLAEAQKALDEAKNAQSEASKTLEEKKAAYEAYVSSSDSEQADLQKKQLDYSDLSSQYATQQSVVASLEQNIASAEAQIASQQTNASQQVQSLLQQFEATRSAVISSLESELEQSEFSLSRTQIKAQQSGVVVETSVDVGSVVSQGSELVRLSSDSGEQSNIVVCYVPLSSGKKITPGMQVMVYPTTVNKQEYGHMEATVLSVDEYVTSTTQMKTMLGDDLLVNSFTQDGPVVAVTCQLRTDETTASGYYWSSKKGADIMLAEGTLVTADIVTERKAPIEMVIPLLKEFFSMKETER